MCSGEPQTLRVKKLTRRYSQPSSPSPSNQSPLVVPHLGFTESLPACYSPPQRQELGRPCVALPAGSGQNTGTVMAPRAGNHTQKRERVWHCPLCRSTALPKTGTDGARRCPGLTTAGGCVHSCLEKGKWALKTQDRLQPMKWLSMNLFHLAFEKVPSRKCFRSRSRCLPERLDTMARCICSTNSKLNLSPSPLSPHSTCTNGTRCQARKLNIPFDFILHSSSFPHYMASHVSFSHLDSPFF